MSSVHELWNNFKCLNKHVTGILQGAKRIIWELLMAEIVSTVIKTLDSQTQDAEAHQVLSTWSLEKITPKHIIFKLLKTSDKENLKIEKKDILYLYREQKVKLTADFSSDTIQAWLYKTSFKYRKKNISQFRSLCLVEMSFKNKGKIKTFSDIKY